MKLQWLAISCDEAPRDDAWLSSHERGRLQSMRVPKRRADFRGGRWAAKRALRGAISNGIETDDKIESAIEIESTKPLDWKDIDVRAAEDGSPFAVLPSGPAQVAISIAHAGGHALAVVGARDAIFGADIEVLEPRSAAFIEDYFTDAERAWIAELAPERRDEAVTLVWSAKESALKAIREGLREDTREVEVTLDAGALPLSDAPVFKPFQVIARSRGRVFSGLASRDGARVITIVAEAASLEAISILPMRQVGE